MKWKSCKSYTNFLELFNELLKQKFTEKQLRHHYRNNVIPERFYIALPTARIFLKTADSTALLIDWLTFCFTILLKNKFPLVRKTVRICWSVGNINYFLPPPQNTGRKIKLKITILFTPPHSFFGVCFFRPKIFFFGFNTFSRKLLLRTYAVSIFLWKVWISRANNSTNTLSYHSENKMKILPRNTGEIRIFHWTSKQASKWNKKSSKHRMKLSFFISLLFVSFHVVQIYFSSLHFLIFVALYRCRLLFPLFTLYR